MARAVVYVDVHTSPWLRDALVAAGEMMTAIENADEVLVTDEILESAARFRAVLERPAEDEDGESVSLL